MRRIIDLQAIEYDPQGFMALLAGEPPEHELASVITLADDVSWDVEAAIVDYPPWSTRIRLRTRDGKSYHRDYLARFAED